jgi:hypothetical protein
MPRGLPDSWFLYGAQKIYGGLKRSSRGFNGRPSRVSNPTHYSYKFQKLILYKPVLDAELRTSKGDLWKTLEFRGKIVLLLAKQQVGKKTGALALSIKMSHKPTRNGQEVKIGSDNKIAYLHHQGTRPHLITPKNHPQLVFMSRGRIIRTQLVRHPGTKPNRYLSDQLYVFQDLGAIYKGKSFPKPPV